MEYVTYYLSLIGKDEGIFIVAVMLLLWIADKVILWHDKALPWKGLLNK